MEVLLFLGLCLIAAFLNSWSISLAQTAAFASKGTGRRLLLEISSVAASVLAFIAFGIGMVLVV